MSNLKNNSIKVEQNGDAVQSFRSSKQPLLPVQLDSDVQAETYHPFPYHPLVKGRIFNGYLSLSKWIVNQKVVLIDGYVGVCWEQVKDELERQISEAGYSVRIYLCSDYLKTEQEILELIAPALGETGSVWGKLSTLELSDFYRLEEFNQLNKCAKGADPVIVLGVGAGLLSVDAPIIYLDVPKNEIQYRMRAGSVRNLGMNTLAEPSAMYKQSYFVDWPVLNAHKKAIIDRISIIADVQWEREVNWMFFSNLVATVSVLGQGVFRARPWFEKGVWGGQWMKEHLKGLNISELNYAWSFELITPENGVVFEHGGYLQEISFDFLMFLEHRNILGQHAEIFGTNFPIRFDFLDTFSGGDLSIQCHPSTTYIQENFGELITQDETYYIMDCRPDAKVYLGFQQDIDPVAFKKVLENSFTNGSPVDITRYVQQLSAAKHDLFLIPNQTVHSAGADNLVLEISSTPYIFTFKMYDWVRLDLDQKPRPINIEHAFRNLNFERKGDRVQQELVSKPRLLEQGEDWQIIHLPTHTEHFYDVERIELKTSLVLQKDDRCWVMMLVEGESVAVHINGQTIQHFNYAETFVISAAVTDLKLINTGQATAKVIKAYLK